MPKERDRSMLRVDTNKFLIEMARAEMTPQELAKASGVSVNTVYLMRRGYLIKPKYIGACARVLEVDVKDIVEVGAGSVGD